MLRVVRLSSPSSEMTKKRLLGLKSVRRTKRTLSKSKRSVELIRMRRIGVLQRLSKLHNGSKLLEKRSLS